MTAMETALAEIPAALEAIGNLTEWFELMDDYRGAERDRVSYLADQFTCFGDEVSHDDWVVNMYHAELLIAEWRTRKNVADFASPAKASRPVPASLNDVTTLVCGDVLRSVRKAS